MKRILIAVPELAVMQAVADPNYCFSAVNAFLSQQGRPPAFEIKLVGASGEVKMGNGQFSVFPDLTYSQVDFTADLVLIPAVFGDMNAAISANSGLVDWVKSQHQKGAEVASLCVGAFILAQTGMVDGKKCSTHWGFIEQFKAMFPAILVQDGQIVTEESGIYSSGGAHSYWNLLLHLVEKFSGREMAILTAKYFAIDIGRTSQLPFSIFQSQKNHRDDAVRKAQDLIEEKLEEKLTVETLADQVAVGRRSFERRFKQATNNSVLEYILRVKIESAKRALETSRKNVNEVMAQIGYNDSKSFRSAFRKITGLSPAEYRNRYQQISAH